MKTSLPLAFAALKIFSMFSIVPFSVTLAPTAPQFAPVSLNTSFCGSINTIAVSVFRMSMAWCSCPALDGFVDDGQQVGDDPLAWLELPPPYCRVLAQYSLQILRSAFFSRVKGGNRCLIATSGGEMSIDLACVSMSNPY